MELAINRALLQNQVGISALPFVKMTKNKIAQACLRLKKTCDEDAEDRDQEVVVETTILILI